MIAIEAEMKRLGNLIVHLFTFSDIVVVGGIGLIGYGTYAIYPPAAWITVGVICVIFGLYRYFN